LFKLTNKRAERETHAGVLEFVADEGTAFLPYWMMNNLCLEEGSIIHVDNVSLPVATFAKFQPQSSEFLDITNPKAVLENALRSFACLTTGDMVALSYNDKIYELKVLETKPQKAVSIIECDMNVDFAPPVGYQEPQKNKPIEDEPMAVDASEYLNDSRFRVFGGQGNRLDGKTKSAAQTGDDVVARHEIKRGIPNYDYKKGTITFIRATRQQNGVVNGKDKETAAKDDSNFTAFAGQGYSLRKQKSNRK